VNSLITIDSVKKDEEQFITDIITTKGNNLPANIEEVINIFEFTDFKAKAWKILANKMSKLDEQSDLYHLALRNGQQWGIAALYARKRRGDITRDMSKRIGSSKSDDGIWKKDRLKEIGLNPQRTSEDEQLSKHPDILDKVVESAKVHNEIPTTREVLNAIKVANAKISNARAQEKSDIKVAKDKTQAVKDYYDIVKGFKSGIKSAIISAKYGDFSAEGKNFLIKKHEEIKNLMSELEGLI